MNPTDAYRKQIRKREIKRNSNPFLGFGGLDLFDRAELVDAFKDKSDVFLSITEAINSATDVIAEFNHDPRFLPENSESLRHNSEMDVQ